MLQFFSLFFFFFGSIGIDVRDSCMQGKLSTTDLQPPHYATAFKLLVLNSKLAERIEGQAEFRVHRPVDCSGAREVSLVHKQFTVSSHGQTGGLFCAQTPG